MKNKIRIIGMLLVLCMVVLLLISCGGTNVEKSGKATVVIESAEGEYTTYAVDLSKLKSYDEGVLSLLKYLNSIEENPLSFSASWGSYGAYLTSVGGISEDANNGKYIYIYTTNGEDFDTSVWVKSLEYDTRLFKSSGVGASQMNIKDGTVILFRLEGF